MNIIGSDRLNAKILSFKENFSWTFISSIIFAFSQWYIVSILAKLGNVEMVGLYSLGLAVNAPIFLFLSMNLRSIIATDLYEITSFSQYLNFRIITSTVAIFFISLIVLIIDFTIEYKIVILLIAGVKWVETLSDLCHGKFQQKENMKYIAFSKIYRSLMSILSFTFVLWLYESLIFSLLIQIITWLMIVIIFDFKNLVIKYKQKLFKPKIDLKLFKKLLIYALPLGIAGTLDSLHANLPRYFISYFDGEEALGIFAGITYIMIAGQTLIVSLSQVAIPRLTRYYIENLTLYKNLIKKLLILAFFIGLIGIVLAVVFGDLILLLLYSTEYRSYKNILILTMITAIFWYMSGFFNAAIIATREFKVQIPIYITSTFVTLILSIILIPPYSLIGAVFSLMAGHIVRCIYSAFVVRRAYLKQYNLT